jgi:hypothetical protein
VKVKCSHAEITPRTKVDASGLPWMLRLRGRLPPEVLDSQPQQKHCGDLTRDALNAFMATWERANYTEAGPRAFTLQTPPGLREKLRYDAVIVNKIAEELASMGIAYLQRVCPKTLASYKLGSIVYVSSLKS